MVRRRHTTAPSFLSHGPAREDRRYEETDQDYYAAPQYAPPQGQRYDRGYAEAWREREEPSYRPPAAYYAPAPYQRETMPWQPEPYRYGYARPYYGGMPPGYGSYPPAPPPWER